MATLVKRLILTAFVNVNRCRRACTVSYPSKLFFRLFAFKVCVILYLNPHPPAAPQPDPTARTSSSGGFKVTPSSGDGRCFFRSLVIGMDSRLQNEARDAHGRLLSQVKHAVETSRADGLRAEVITYMMDNYSDYKDLDLAVINSNMPVHFASVDERIIAMTGPKCLPGELEIVATSRAMKKKSVYLEKTTMK